MEIIGCLIVGVIGPATRCVAGMPSPLPTEDDLERVMRLDGTAQLRLETISFFLAGIFLSAAIVRWLWNSVVRDSPSLPRLNYSRALAGVILWGLLFILVLAMISGARELMTPGAWKKQGWTYKLADGAASDLEPTAARQRGLENLRLALWQFAARHEGRFPNSAECADWPLDLWIVPESPGLRFQYVEGRNANEKDALLAYEPVRSNSRQLILTTNGQITLVTPDEIHARLDWKVTP